MKKCQHQCHWHYRIVISLSEASLFVLLCVLVFDVSSLRCRNRNHQHHHCEAFILSLPQSLPHVKFNSHNRHHLCGELLRKKSCTSTLLDTRKISNDAVPLSSMYHIGSAQDDEANDEPATTAHQNDAYIIQWRGEGTEGYSDALRQLEFTSAFRAEMKDYFQLRSSVDNPNCKNDYNCEDYDIQFRFQNALSYSGPMLDHKDQSAWSSSPPPATSLSSSNDHNHTNHHAEFRGHQSNIPHLLQVQAYESAMQYVKISLHRRPSENAWTIDTDAQGNIMAVIVHEIFINTIKRCSLVRTAFQIVAGGRETLDDCSYAELATEALENHSFDDMILNGGINANSTWSIRLRRYGPLELVEAKRHNNKQQQQVPSSTKRPPRQARYGKNVRSPLTDEREAILSMAELVKLFRGKVHLEDPLCSIYLLEGLRPIRRNWASSCDTKYDIVTTFDKSNIAEKRSSNKLLARVVAKGPKTSTFAPNTRICITTTPLCPIASFTLCNIAQLQRHGNCSILDPFAGSCATLLAAAHITSLPTLPPYSSFFNGSQLNPSGCRSVGIEVAHDGYVNRDDIVHDFVHRSLRPPLELIRGNCFSPEVRHRARLAIGGGPFDAIVADPPYGIREALSSGSATQIEDGTISISPLTELFYAMGHDRLHAGAPLLRRGGRLVAFVPVRRKEECVKDCLPDSSAMEAAGLIMEDEPKEQVLSDVLSRWLVSFVGL